MVTLPGPNKRVLNLQTNSVLPTVHSQLFEPCYAAPFIFGRELFQFEELGSPMWMLEYFPFEHAEQYVAYDIGESIDVSHINLLCLRCLKGDIVAGFKGMAAKF